MICEMSDDPPVSCSGSSNSSAANNGNSAIGQNASRPQGVSLRIDINYDDYPTETAWVLYDDDTKKELYWSDYGSVTTPGLHSKTFDNLKPGTYVFLILDQFFDGICCR